MDLIHEAREHLRLRGDIAIDQPVRLLHGMLDPDVPWKRSLLLAEKLRCADVRVILVKDGDHRLSRDEDLALLTRTVGELLRRTGRTPAPARRRAAPSTPSDSRDRRASRPAPS